MKFIQNIRNLGKVQLSELEQTARTKKSQKGTSDHLGQSHNDQIKVTSPFYHRHDFSKGPCDCPYHRMKRYHEMIKHTKVQRSTVKRQILQKYKLQLAKSGSIQKQKCKEAVKPVRHAYQQDKTVSQQFKASVFPRIKKVENLELLDNINHRFQEILKQRIKPIPDEEKVSLLLKFIKIRTKQDPEYLKRSKTYIFNYLKSLIKKITFQQLCSIKREDQGKLTKIGVLINSSKQKGHEFVEDVKRAFKEMEEFLLRQAKQKGLELTKIQGDIQKSLKYLVQSANSSKINFHSLKSEQNSQLRNYSNYVQQEYEMAKSKNKDEEDKNIEYLKGVLASSKKLGEESPRRNLRRNAQMLNTSSDNHQNEGHNHQKYEKEKQGQKTRQMSQRQRRSNQEADRDEEEDEQIESQRNKQKNENEGLENKENKNESEKNILKLSENSQNIVQSHEEGRQKDKQTIKNGAEIENNVQYQKNCVKIVESSIIKQKQSNIVHDAKIQVQNSIEQTTITTPKSNNIKKTSGLPKFQFETGEELNDLIKQASYNVQEHKQENTQKKLQANNQNIPKNSFLSLQNFQLKNDSLNSRSSRRDMKKRSRQEIPIGNAQSKRTKDNQKTKKRGDRIDSKNKNSSKIEQKKEKTVKNIFDSLDFGQFFKPADIYRAKAYVLDTFMTNQKKAEKLWALLEKMLRDNQALFDKFIEYFLKILTDLQIQILKYKFNEWKCKVNLEKLTKHLDQCLQQLSLVTLKQEFVDNEDADFKRNKVKVNKFIELQCDSTSKKIYSNMNSMAVLLDGLPEFIQKQVDHLDQAQLGEMQLLSVRRNTRKTISLPLIDQKTDNQILYNFSVHKIRIKKSEHKKVLQFMKLKHPKIFTEIQNTIKVNPGYEGEL